VNNQDILPTNEEATASLASNKRGINGSLIFRIILFIILLFYLYSLFFGESSIGVLQDTKDRYNKLNSQYTKILDNNQKLQKKHFELIQLTPQEDSF
jgi:hypothetical protein